MQSPVMPSVPEVFRHSRYTIRRRLINILGQAFHILDDTGRVIGFSKLKAFRLREDIRLYTDERATEELLVIQAREVIDFSASYDVLDAQMNQPVGTLRRRGFKSLLQDEWQMLDVNGQEIGTITEDSMALALVRRFLSNLVPQRFDATVGGQLAAQYRQRFNPFVLKLDVELLGLPTVDPRLLLAGGVLLAAIEGRQEG